jgi:REP element-mobilizing transposase RayT
MMSEYPQFFTSTIFLWKKLLKKDKYKDIIIESLRFLVKENRVVVYGFVIMPNHIHLIWQMREGINPSHLQRDFLKYTAQQIRFDLKNNHPQVLEHFKVDLKDRSYQIWENRPLSIPLWSQTVFKQKLDYIHKNPIQEKWKLVDIEEQYYYSSAKYYLLNEDDFGFITHYKHI